MDNIILNYVVQYFPLHTILFLSFVNKDMSSKIHKLYKKIKENRAYPAKEKLLFNGKIPKKPLFSFEEKDFESCPWKHKYSSYQERFETTNIGQVFLLLTLTGKHKRIKYLFMKYRNNTIFNVLREYFLYFSIRFAQRKIYNFCLGRVRISSFVDQFLIENQKGIDFFFNEFGYLSLTIVRVLPLHNTKKEIKSIFKKYFSVSWTHNIGYHIEYFADHYPNELIKYHRYILDVYYVPKKLILLDNVDIFLKLLAEYKNPEIVKILCNDYFSKIPKITKFIFNQYFDK